MTKDINIVNIIYEDNIAYWLLHDNAKHASPELYYWNIDVQDMDDLIQ